MEKSLWLDQSLTVNADTVYVNTIGGEQVLAGKNVEVSFPDVKYITLNTTAMGDYKVAQRHQLEAMEMTIQHIGVDEGLAALCMAEMLEIEIRWVEQLMEEDGGMKRIGCKAFMNAHPQVAAPKFKVKPGDPVTIDIPYHVHGYKLVKDGVVMWDIDRLGHRLIVNNEDYYAHLESMI